MRNIFTILFLLLILHCQSQTLEWAKSYGGFVYVKDMITDNDGNIYTTGGFYNNTDFDPGPGTYYLDGGPYSNIFVQKLDANGNFLWAVSTGGANIDSGEAICLDNDGNVYISGCYAGGNLHTHPDSNLYIPFGGGVQDAFILKLRSTGTFCWAKTIAGPFGDLAYGIEINENADLYVSGNFYGSVDFDPGPDTTYLTASGSHDIFILRIDSLGNYINAKSFGGAQNEKMTAMTRSAMGNIYITGQFSYACDFDPGPSSFVLTPPEIGVPDVFILKLDANENFIWAKSPSGPHIQESFDICSDPFESIYVVGETRKTVDFDPGIGVYSVTNASGLDGFVLKLDYTGNFEWVNTYGGSDDSWGTSTTSVGTDNYGHVYTLGSFSDTVIFHYGIDSLVFTPPNHNGDIFVQILDNDGNQMWTKFFGGPNSDQARSIHVDYENNFYLSSIISNTIDLDPGTDSVMVPPWAALQKFNPSPVLNNSDQFYTGTNMVSVFPNPTSGPINFRFNCLYKEAFIEIYSLEGKKLYSNKIGYSKQYTIESLPASGLYFINVTFENGEKVSFKCLKN